jgi:hypothetical protein
MKTFNGVTEVLSAHCSTDLHGMKKEKKRKKRKEKKRKEKKRKEKKRKEKIAGIQGRSTDT